MFFKKNSPEYLVVGLGNFGPKYENTRHNAGFMFADALAEKLGVDFSKNKFHSLCAEATISGKRCLIMKPLTFMNDSGIAVGEASRFYKIKPEKIIVIFDDISLSIGGVRLRKKGSDGGHNGIKSIIAHLNSEDFPRIKMGIGAKPHPEYDLASWVLSKFSQEDIKLLNQAIDNTLGAVDMIISGDFETAMNKFNKKA